MIDITGVDLVKFVKAVYDFSVPQGLGFLHATDEPLTDDEAKQYIIDQEGRSAVSMDYVKGRACKMHVYREGNKLLLPDTWYDHTDRIYDELLSKFGFTRKQAEQEHGCSCNCMDCQSRRAMTS